MAPSVQVYLVTPSGELGSILGIQPPTPEGLLETVQFKAYSVVTESDYVWVLEDNGRELFDPEVDRKLKAAHRQACVNGLLLAGFAHDDRQYTVDFTSPQLWEQNSPRAQLLQRRPPFWYYKVQDSDMSDLGFIKHEDKDSAIIEEMYRYGGRNITMGGTQYTFIFSADKSFQVDVNTFDMIEITRYPPITSNPCEIKVRISIQGTPESVAVVEAQLDQICQSYYSREISFTFPTDYRIQNIILQQIANVTRQYCVSADHKITESVLSTKLKGAEWYVHGVAALLSSLIAELYTQYVASLSSGVPKTWKPQTEDCELKPVSKGSQEWKDVFDCVKATLPNVEMIKLERVQNRPLWQKYELEKKLMHKRNNGDINEKYLFHGSRQIDPKDIVFSSAGVDFRYSSRDRTLLWGAGAYFAVKASYSDRCAYLTPDKVRQLILAQVLTGKSCSYGNAKEYSLTKPPQLPGARPGVLYDTVNGEAGRLTESTVYVTYDHDKSYPAYIITYRWLHSF